MLADEAAIRLLRIDKWQIDVVAQYRGYRNQNAVGLLARMEYDAALHVLFQHFPRVLDDPPHDNRPGVGVDERRDVVDDRGKDGRAGARDDFSGASALAGLQIRAKNLRQHPSAR